MKNPTQPSSPRWLDKCRNDLEAQQYFLGRPEEAQQYFLGRPEEVPEAITINHPTTCGGYIHFEHIDHPRLGHCAKGELEAMVG